MGTLFSIRLYGNDPRLSAEAAESAFAEVKRLNAMFSDYEPESELLRFCRANPGSKVPLSPEFHEILGIANQLSQQTNGRFDVTIGPLARLWRQSRRLNRLPTREQMELAFERTGFEKLKLFEDGSASLAEPDMRLDLGGIAKGYAADKALEVLAKSGFPSALVAASGDLAIGDAPPGKFGWRIGLNSVASPEQPDRFVTLANCGVSTSGDTQQFVILEGRRYSHIVDPETSLGLTTRRSVTIIAQNATMSDSLATAWSVLKASPSRLATWPDTIVRLIEENSEGQFESQFWGHFGGITWDLDRGIPLIPAQKTLPPLPWSPPRTELDSCPVTQQ